MVGYRRVAAEKRSLINEWSNIQLSITTSAFLADIINFLELIIYFLQDDGSSNRKIQLGVDVRLM